MSEPPAAVRSAARPRPKVDINVLSHNSHQLIPAARTLSLSFSNDPLISWLYRPGTQTWGELNPENQIWQTRRVAYAATARIAVAGMGRNIRGQDDCLGMMIVYPPQSHHYSWWFSQRRLFGMLQLFLTTIFNKAQQQSCDEDRAKIMFSRHAQVIKDHVPNPDDFWYLEVMAVEPDAQGMGVASRLMQWLFDQIGEKSCILECTADQNVSLYERFGFRVVEIVELADERGSTKEWIMIREGKKLSEYTVVLGHRYHSVTTIGYVRDDDNA